MKKIIFILCLEIFFTFSFAASLRPFRATYSVKYHGITLGYAVRTFTIDKNKNYFLSVKTEPSFPLLSLSSLEKSQGIWTTDGPLPTKYEYHYQFFQKIRNVVMNIDRKNHLATTQKDERHYKVKIPDNVQDKLSYQLAIQQDLLNNKKTFIYYLADRGNVYDYDFAITGEETLVTPMGKLKTVRMQRTNSDGDDIFIFWVAPKLDYTLVKIIDIEDDTVVAEANLKSYILLK